MRNSIRDHWVLCLAGVIALSVISVPSFALGGKKVLVVYDMEGITGADTAGSYDTTSPEYPRVQQSLTDDVNAVIKGLKEAGATDIVITDCHASGNTTGPDYLVSQMPAGARFDIRDKPYDPYVEGVDKSYDAMVMVGMHVYAGDPNGGFTPHTYFGLVRWTLNGLKMSETAEVGFSAAAQGVPLILVSGDDVHKAEVAAFSKAEYVVVKKAISATKAEPRDRATVSEELTEAAARGFKNRKQIGLASVPKGPMVSKWIFPYADYTAMASNFPGVTIDNDKTLSLTTNTYMEAMLDYRSISNLMRYVSSASLVQILAASPNGAQEMKDLRAKMPPRDYTPTSNPVTVDNKLNKWGYE